MKKNILYWSMVVLTSVSVSVFADSGRDSCTNYEKLETQFQCGPEGYIQQFAKPYCETFLARKKYFSPRGQSILRNIRICLQETIIANSAGMTCDELGAYGFASHEACYIQAGYCELEPADMAQIFWIARSELVSLQIWQLASRVHLWCIKNN